MKTNKDKATEKQNDVLDIVKEMAKQAAPKKLDFCNDPILKYTIARKKGGDQEQTGHG